MAQPQLVPLTDDELLQIANDPSITDADLAKLTPDEAQRFSGLRRSTPAQEQNNSLMSWLGGMVDSADSLATGAFKGAGESAFNLGSAVRQIPGIGHATDALAKLLGPEGTDPEQAFARLPPDLESANATEGIGKALEQVAEFFLPAGKVGQLAARPLLEAFLKTPSKALKASPVLKHGLNAGMKASTMAGDAMGTGAVSALHGEENPQYAAATSAGGALAGEGASQIAKLLNTKAGAQLAPILAAIAAMQAGDAMGLGVGGTMSGGLAAGAAGRSIARRALTSPGAAGRLGWAAEKTGRNVGTAGAGVVDQERKAKRKPLR